MAKKGWARFGIILQIISWLYIGLVLYALYIFIIMTLNGSFVDIEFYAWLWVVSSTFPLLFSSIYLNFDINLSWKEFKKNYLIAYHFFIGFYMVILVWTYKSMFPWVLHHEPDDNKKAVDDYITMSYLWLVPCQVVLFVLIGIIVKNSRTLIKLDQVKIAELEKEASNSQIGNEEKRAFQFLIDSKFSHLFDFLEPYIKDEEEMKTFLMIKSRYNSLFETRLRRTESTEYLTLVSQQISSDLIEVIRRCFSAKTNNSN